MVGIPKDLFDLLVSALYPYFESKGRKGVSKSKLAVEDILLMTFYFFRNCVPLFNFGIIYKLNDSNVYGWIKWNEAVLLMKYHGTIDIKFLNDNSNQLIDVMECTITKI